MDHVAYEINKDPLEVRKNNISTKRYPDFTTKYISDLQTWADIQKRRADIDTFNKVKLN